jgi:hypothetical protein
MYISRLSEKQMVENQYLPLWNWLQQSAVQGALPNNRGGLMLSRNFEFMKKDFVPYD